MATAARRILREALMTQVSVPGSKEMKGIQESISAALRTFQRSKKDTKKVVQTRLAHSRSQLTTAIGIRSPKNISERSLTSALASVSPSIPSLSDKASLCQSARPRPRIVVTVLEVSSGDYIEAQNISRATMSKSESRSDETPCLRMKRKITRKEHRKMRAQASASYRTLPSLCASEVDVFDKYRLREKLKAVPCSALKSLLQSLKMDTRDERPGNFSDSGSSGPSLSRSCGLYQNADPRNTQAGQRELRTERTHFENVFLSKPLLNRLNVPSSYNGPVASYCFFFSLLSSSK